MWSPQSLLHFPFAARIGSAEKIEEIRILEDLGRHVRSGGRHREGEITGGLPLPLVKSGLDLELQNVVRPALRSTLTRIPEAILWAFALLQQRDMVIPGYLCKNLLHNCGMRPGSRQGPHVFEVTRRQAAHIRKRLAQVGGESVDNPGTPAFALLPFQYQPPDIPIEHNHGRIGRHNDAQALSLDASLDLTENAPVAVGQPGMRRRCRKRGVPWFAALRTAPAGRCGGCLPLDLLLHIANISKFSCFLTTIPSSIQLW
jgi:hypothetical protein